MLAVFHLLVLPVPEIIVQQTSAMTELLTQRAQDRSRPIDFTFTKARRLRSCTHTR